MSECPAPDRLQKLLAGTLPDAEQAAVEEHVDGCAACQGALDRLTAAPTQLAQAIDPKATTFIARVQALSPGSGGFRLPSKPQPPPEIPGYEIEGELGRGGMGVVYKARHRRLNRHVALKMLVDSVLSDVDIRTRFLIEAETVAQLRHPHIVQVYEFGESAGRPYLAMEFMDGGNLNEWLTRGHRLAPVRAAELVARLADAVAAAHAKGVIHRDLKPSNILLGAPDPAAGAGAVLVAKVADFGIARVGRSEMTATGEVLGTPSYMAPEQAGGQSRDIGTATDVYGLGAILYELLTERPPFEGETAINIIQQVIHTAPRPPRSVSRLVPRDIETICLKCLEKDPQRRYATAAALAADLRSYLEGRTIAARPAPAWEHAARLVRRNPVPALALALMAATTVAAFVWVDDARRDQQRARGEEEGARVLAEKNERDANAARKVAERGAARLAFERALALFDAGNVVAGLAELDRTREAAARAGDSELVAVVERNRAVAGAYRPREVRAFDPPDPLRPLSAAVYSEDKRLLITGGPSGPVRVWPVRGALPDGQTRWELPAPDPDRPGVVGLFPATGARLFAVYESGHVSEWDLSTGRVVRHDPAFDTPSPIRAVGGTVPGREGSGRLIVAGSADGTYRVWDADEHRLFTLPDDTTVSRHAFLGPKKKARLDPLPTEPGRVGAVTGIDFGDNGNMLLTAGTRDGVVLLGLPLPKTGRLLDPIRDGAIDPAVPYHHFDFGGEVFRLLVGPDRQLFLAGGATAVSLWTIHDRERPIWVHSHPDQVTALAFSPDRRLCASADRGGTVRCRDVASGALQAEIHFPDPVLALRFSPDAAGHLLIGRQNGSSVLWQLPVRSALTERRVEPTLHGPGITIRIGFNPDQAVHAVGFDPLTRGEWAATARRFVLWPKDGSAGYDEHPEGDETFAPHGIAVAPDGRSAVAAVTGRDTLFVWNHATAPRTAGRVPAVGVTQVGFVSPTSFFTVSEEPVPGTNRVRERVGRWELDGKGGATRRTNWSLSDVGCVAPHPNGKLILVGRSEGGRTGFWELDTGREIGPALPGGPVASVAVDPGGRWAAIGGPDGGVRVWQLGGDGLPQHAVERPLLHGGRVNAIAFGTGPSAGVLVTASSDGTARFWDAKTGYPLGPPLRHPEAVLSVSFDPTGAKVITGGRNGSAKIWPAPKAATD